MGRKGISEIAVGTLLIMIGLMAGTMFYLHSQGSLDSIFKLFEDTREVQVNTDGALIFIENITGDKIYVTNKGTVNISSSAFAVFLNASRLNPDTLEILSSSVTELTPAKTTTLTVCHQTGLVSEDYFVVVSGPYKTFDELRQDITIPSC